MRKTVMIIATVMTAFGLTIASPSDAEARFGAGAIANAAAAVSSAQPAQSHSYGEYSRQRTQQIPIYVPGYEPRSYAPAYKPPSVTDLGYAPRYRAPAPLPSYMDHTTREGINSCIAC